MGALPRKTGIVVALVWIKRQHTYLIIGGGGWMKYVYDCHTGIAVKGEEN